MLIRLDKSIEALVLGDFDWQRGRFVSSDAAVRNERLEKAFHAQFQLLILIDMNFILMQVTDQHLKCGIDI